MKNKTGILEHPFLGRGFRIFFFLGALHSVFSLIVWGGFYAGYVMPPYVLLDPVSWHAHEMIYGFVLAIVAGFLLTAVANWTGGAPVRQMHLAALSSIWLMGRIVVSFDVGLPYWGIVLIENTFVPALAISLSVPLLKSWNKRNFVFLVLLTLLFVSDLLFMTMEDKRFLYVAIMVIMIMISLIGGRIIPAFTVSALRRRGEEAFQTPQTKMDVLALLSLVMIICLLFVWGTEGKFLALIAFASSLIHVLRMRYYHTFKILNDPMVWILHAGYGWMVLGLFFIGCSALGLLPFSTALHILTVGAIGSMTLGMMCRVTLGHTGRNLISGILTTTIFFLMQIAVLVRVLGPVFSPEYMSLWIIGTAGLWSLCYLIYLVVYTPMLWYPRPDGRPT